MNSLIFSVNATMPIFLIMIIGWIIRKVGIIDENFTIKANDYVFKIGLPVLLFKDLNSVDFHSNFSIDLLLFCIIVTTVMVALIWILTDIFMKEDSEKGAFIQGAFRSSAAVLGIAFIENMYDSAGMAPMMIVGVVPLFNAYSVLVLTFNSKDNDRRSSKKEVIKNALSNIAKNPIIWGVILGLLSSLIGIDYPQVIDRTINGIAQTATPFALICVGASFEGGKAIKKIRPAMLATFIKLIALPALFLPFAIMSGFRYQELVSILVLLASPTTVTSFIMAKAMGNDEVLTSSIIVLTTLFSIVTLTGWIFILHLLSYI
ncbi:MAG: AEC family transporter [Candidatus Limimorpha sp.]